MPRAPSGEGRFAGVRQYAPSAAWSRRCAAGRRAGASRGPSALRRRQRHRPVVSNDNLARLCWQRHAALSIPGSIAVIGVDDIPAGQWTDPPLTTIAFELDRISARILNLVARALGPPAPSLESAGEPELVVRMRGSVG